MSQLGSQASASTVLPSSLGTAETHAFVPSSSNDEVGAAENPVSKEPKGSWASALSDTEGSSFVENSEAEGVLTSVTGIVTVPVEVGVELRE